MTETLSLNNDSYKLGNDQKNKRGEQTSRIFDPKPKKSTYNHKYYHENKWRFKLYNKRYRLTNPDQRKDDRHSEGYAKNKYLTKVARESLKEHVFLMQLESQTSHFSQQPNGEKHKTPITLSPHSNKDMFFCASTR